MGSKWVYKWKTDASGAIVKAKARLVAKGFSQVEGVDFFETFAPTPAAATIRLLAAVACKLDWDLHHFDVEQAFVQSQLDTEVYLRLPPGCGHLSGKVVRLNKSLYGLKQASRTWHHLLISTLKGIGFEQCLTDPCVMRLILKGVVVGVLVVHVDDLLFGGLRSTSDEVVAALNDTFPTKHLGDLTWYMGREYRRDRKAGTLEISQTTFIRGMLERFNVSRLSPIPASPSVDLRNLDGGEESVADKPFREVVGSLLWVANQTRPDIANAVRAVARFSHDPKTVHWKAVERILKYLRATADLGLTYRKEDSLDGDLSCVLDLGVYVDADYASKATDRRSVSGVTVVCGGSPVAWFSRTQKCVTLSTTEAEYVAMGDGVKEAIFMRGVLTFFLVPDYKLEHIEVFEDNEGAKALAENPLSSSNSKHIDVRHHFLRELVAKGDIVVKYVPSLEQHADILTKALARELFEKHRNFVLGIT